MSYSLDTSHDSPAVTAGRSGRRIEWITIHHWGADGQTHDGVVAYLTRAGADTSAHYVASAGRVSCIVDPDDTAWHAGDWDANLRSVGIECRPEMSDADIETVAELIAELRGTYGDLPLRPHRDFFATACPGRWGQALARLDARARQLRSGAASKPTPTPTATPAAKPAPAFDVEAAARQVIAGAYGNGAERRARLGSHYAAVQARVNQILTGTATPKPKPKPAFDVNAAAQAVIRGEYGNGEERRARLGSHYDQVQALVNKMLGA